MEKNIYNEDNDSYIKFINEFCGSKDKFIEWGLNNIIYPENNNEFQKAWENVINGTKWEKENEKCSYIRGYGRNSAGTKYFIEINKRILRALGSTCKNVFADPTNNTKPKALLEDLTGLKRNKAGKNKTTIYNYQVSHIFGKTKNFLLFTAPWNVCYTPKMIDPLTGHETYKSKMATSFYKQWQDQIFELYGEYIKEYNDIINREAVQNEIKNYKNEIDSSSELEEKQKEQLKKDIDSAFSTIKKGAFSSVFLEEVALTAAEE